MLLPELRDRAHQISGHQFENTDLLVIAFTHASSAESRLTSNERLEFLGDAVLGLVVCQELFNRYPKHLEGELTKIKSVVVSRKVCTEIADETGLTRLLKLGKGMTESEVVPASVRAGVLEAFVAALYIDGGLDVARRFIVEKTMKYIKQAADSENKRNYKSYLQQHVQKYMDTTPRYEALDEKGPDHSKCFEVAVVIDSRRYPSAWAPSKKEAEQRAALLALQELNLASEEDGEEYMAGSA